MNPPPQRPTPQLPRRGNELLHKYCERLIVEVITGKAHIPKAVLQLAQDAAKPEEASKLQIFLQTDYAAESLILDKPLAH
ncbi:MAG: hypothetical protein ONB12_05945 [candidate division KSB1 bacterium]|nr:hypothetical protein [candidate division KSB1 bacterium]